MVIPLPPSFGFTKYPTRRLDFYFYHTLSDKLYEQWFLPILQPMESFRCRFCPKNIQNIQMLTTLCILQPLPLLHQIAYLGIPKTHLPSYKKIFMINHPHPHIHRLWRSTVQAFVLQQWNLSERREDHASPTISTSSSSVINHGFEDLEPS